MSSIARESRIAQILAGLLCAIVGALPAVAAPPTPITPVSERTIDATPVTLSFDVAGRSLASWAGLRGTNPDQATRFAALAGRSGAGAWRPGAALPATIVDHDIAIYGSRTAALATWRQEPLSRNRSRSSIVLTLGDMASLRFSDPHRLDSGPARRITFEGPQPTVYLPAVAATLNRDVFVSWTRSYPEDDAGVYFGGRLRDQPFMRARLIGPRGGESYLSASPDGTVLLAWRRGRRVLARVRYKSGRWGRQETVATVPDGMSIEHVWMTSASGRRFAAGVVSTRRSMSGVRTRLAVSALIPGAGWRSGVLGEYDFVATAQTAFVSDQLRVLPFYTSEGRLRVAWPNLVDGHVRVSVSALVPETGGVGTGPPTGVSQAGVDAALESVATGPGGRYAIAWFDLSDGRGAPGLGEGDATGITSVTPRLASERAVRGARVAYDPTTGRPTMVWSEGSYPAGQRIVAWSAP